MSVSFARPLVCNKRAACPKSINTTQFDYDAATLPYPTDTIPLSLLSRCPDQLVISGDIPAPNTPVYMPPHTALLALFRNPQVDDQFAIDVSNKGANSVDLTIYKANDEPTGSPLVVYTQPMRIATIPAASVVRLYLRVVDPTRSVGVADVKMLTTLEGGTGSVPTPVIVFNMTALSASAVLLPQQIVQAVGPFEYMFTNAAAAGTVSLPAVPTPANGPAQMLFPLGNVSAPSLISPLVDGDTFELVVTSTNNSGYNITWQDGGITGVTLTGSTTQPTGTSYTITFAFTIAGTAPDWQTSTLSVDCANSLSSRVGELITGLSTPTPAASFLKADGAVLAQSDYPSLYSKIGLQPLFQFGSQSSMNIGGVSNELVSIAYSPDLTLYVSVSRFTTSAVIQTSTDGNTWTQVDTQPLTHKVLEPDSYGAKIIWSATLGKFIVALESSTLFTSNDGFQYTAVETYTGVKIQQIADSGTVICAFGEQPPVGGLNRVLTTTDLVTWTKTILPNADDAYTWSQDLHYASGLAQDIFCLSLDGGTTKLFQLSNADPPVVTERSSGALGTVVQFASDGNSIYVLADAGTSYTPDLMASFTSCNAASNFADNGISGLAVNQAATGSGARILTAGPVAIYTSQVGLAVNTLIPTFGTTTNVVTNNNDLLSHNAAIGYVRVYGEIVDSAPYSADLLTWSNTEFINSRDFFYCTAADPAGLVVVAGGTPAGIIQTSPDGFVYTARAPGAVTSILHLIWAVDKFVATTATQLITSVDGGVTWVIQASATLSAFNGLAYGGGLYVCITSLVTSANNYMTSADGLTWVEQQLDSGAELNGVAHDGTTWLMTTTESTTWTSADGLAWTERQGWYNNLYNCVVAATDVFLLFSNNPAATALNGPCQGAVSTDHGVTFEYVTIPQNVQSINYANSLFVAQGRNGEFATSVDAKVWIPVKRQTTAAATGHAEFLDDKYFISTSAGLMVSEDNAATWSYPFSPSFLTSVYAFNRLFAAGTAPIQYSTDAGDTWTIPLGLTGGRINELAYSADTTPPVLVAVGELGTLLTSPDGDIWTQLFVDGSLQSIEDLAVNYTTVVWGGPTGGRLFVGGSDLGGRVFTSADGIAWTETATGSQGQMTQICWNDSLALFCAVGLNGYMATSVDGTTWIERRSPVLTDLQGVASLEDLGFVAVMTESAGLVHSADGVNWEVAGVGQVVLGCKIYYSVELLGVPLASTGLPSYLFTNDGQSVTYGQGSSSGGGVQFAGIRYDPTLDALVGVSTVSVNVLPRAYNLATEFALPTMANTWIRAS